MDIDKDVSEVMRFKESPLCKLFLNVLDLIKTLFKVGVWLFDEKIFQKMLYRLQFIVVNSMRWGV